MVTQNVLRTQVGKNVRTEKNRYKLVIESMVLLLDGNSGKNVFREKNGYKLAIESMVLLLDGNLEHVAHARRKIWAEKKMNTNWLLRVWYFNWMLNYNVLRTQEGKMCAEKRMDINWLLRAWYFY